MDSTNDEVAEMRASDTIVGKIVWKYISHPLTYARFLAQVGHQPVNSYHLRSIFGDGFWLVPNFFVYAKYIYSISGYKGMYVGLSPILLGTVVEHFSDTVLFDYIKIDISQKKYCSKESNLEVWKKCALLMSKQMLLVATRIILGYPFHVVSMRMMAQHVGHEYRYTSVLKSLLLIYREEGLCGLYAGIVPRLLALFGSVFLVTVTNQAFSSYVSYSNYSPIAVDVFEFVFMHFVTMFTYPFRVVSACSAINNCGLRVGMPPDMPVFGNWLECLKYMYNLDSLHRDSSWLRRMTLRRVLCKH